MSSGCYQQQFDKRLASSLPTAVQHLMVLCHRLFLEAKEQVNLQLWSPAIEEKWGETCPLMPHAVVGMHDMRQMLLPLIFLLHLKGAQHLKQCLI